MQKTLRRSQGDRRYTLPLVILAAFLLLLTALTLLLRYDVSTRSYPIEYSAYVETYAAEYNLPPHLVYAIIRTESAFDSCAVSSVGAIGLMQLMPDTFTWISADLLGDHFDVSMAYDPETNIRYGCYYLRRLYNRYGDIHAALAAYNAGPGRVDGWLKQPELVDETGALIPEAIPIRETRRYVASVLDAYHNYDALYPTH